MNDLFHYLRIFSIVVGSVAIVVGIRLAMPRPNDDQPLSVTAVGVTEVGLGLSNAVSQPTPPAVVAEAQDETQVSQSITSNLENDAKPIGKVRLVVATFDEQGVPAGTGDLVADMLIRAIDSPAIELLERRQVRRLLEEQAFATSDLTQPGEAIRYGKLVDSRFVLVGSVYRIDGLYVVSARIVDSSTGVIHESSRADVEFRTVDEMAARVTDLAYVLKLRKGPGPIQVPVAPVESTQAGTVQELLERVGSNAQVEAEMSIGNLGRQLAVGTELQIKLQSKRDGFVSLFVVDAIGRVSILVPNKKVPQLRIHAGDSVRIPQDLGFNLRVSPPLGLTRLKAVITEKPIVIPPDSDEASLLRRVQLGDPIDAQSGVDSAAWTTAELEFLVIPAKKPAASPEANAVQPPNSPPYPDKRIVTTDPKAAIDAAFLALTEDRPAALWDNWSALRWPLVSSLKPSIDIGWVASDTRIIRSIRIAVIDADFDPDDAILSSAFRELDPAVRDDLRSQIRRNGRAKFRHGNRVASLIAGEAPWLPSALPGAIIVPIRVASIMDGPSYRINPGDASLLLAGLKSAINAECRVINLSLSVALHGDQLAKFIGDPVWQELQDKGVIVVCAAGNQGEDLDHDPQYPACIDRPNILCVGAIGLDGGLAKWSSGGSAYGAHTVDLMAPGVFLAVSDGGGTAGLAEGTSYSCGFAAAAVALAMQQQPNLSPSEIIARMVSCAVASPALAGRCRGGLLRWPVVTR